MTCYDEEYFYLLFTTSCYLLLKKFTFLSNLNKLFLKNSREPSVKQKIPTQLNVHVFNFNILYLGLEPKTL